MTPDWTMLDPGAVTPGNDRYYVEPPAGTAKQVAAWVDAGGGAVLLAGPRGCGKSMILARAADRLRGQHLVVLTAPPPQAFDGQFDPIRFLVQIVGDCAHRIEERTGSKLSPRLRNSLGDYGVQLLPIASEMEGKHRGSTEQLVADVLKEIVEKLKQLSIVILIDGLDKHEPSRRDRLLAVLQRLPRTFKLVLALPLSAVQRATGEPIVGAGERIMTIIARGGGDHEPPFLPTILERRLGLGEGLLGRGPSASRVAGRHLRELTPPTEALDAIGLAQRWSGGIPGIFLNLLRMASLSAATHQQAWPFVTDIEGAVRAELMRLQSSLQPGDKVALRQSDGTDASEIEPDRKGRFLDQGLLLEVPGQPWLVYELHPLAREAERKRPKGPQRLSLREPALPRAEAAWRVIETSHASQLQQLSIGQYRGLTDVTLSGLGRINLLVGVNNSGKTSVLEAVHALAHLADPRGLIEALRRRARGLNGEDERWIYDQLPRPIEVRTTLSDGSDASISGKRKEDPEDPNEDRASWLGAVEIEAKAGALRSRTISDFRSGKAMETRLRGESVWLRASVLHSPFSPSDGDQISAHYDESVKAGTRQEVVEFIRKHVDPDVKDITYIKENGQFIVNHKIRGSNTDLTSFGDGMQRVYRMGLMFAQAQGGLALIDEFENGIHANVLLPLSRFVQELAELFNVQLFLTTHSKETVDAFALNGHRNQDKVAFALYQKEVGLEVVRFDGSLLERAVKAIGVDIRRR